MLPTIRMRSRAIRSVAASGALLRVSARGNSGDEKSGEAGAPSTVASGVEGDRFAPTPESGGTAMPYTRVNSSHWWVEEPESKYYNSMHSATGSDFPLTESGDRGSEHLVDHPTQYAKAPIINFNRWPATPGRGAGAFLHLNGSGTTADCVSVPRATMDRIMSWIQPGAHPKIAIG